MSRKDDTGRSNLSLWPLGKKPALPSDSDVISAVNFFRRPNQLVWFEGHAGGNEGFSASISFNVAAYSAGNGFIELALREASLQLETADPSGWNWSEYVTQFVKGAVDSVGLKLGRQETQTRKGATTAKVAASAEGGLNWGFVAAKANTQVSVDHTESGEKGATESAEATRTKFERWAEITRPAGRFQLRLSSPPGEDLVRFNSELGRVPLLSAPEPSAVEDHTVKVVMSLHLKEELRHAIRIRDAGGVWRGLIETRNKQVVSELLLNRFLRPVHQPFRLWPPKALRK